MYEESEPIRRAVGGWRSSWCSTRRAPAEVAIECDGEQATATAAL